MKVIPSYHAKKRLTERGIEMQDVLDIIEMPEYTIYKCNNLDMEMKIEYD